MTVAEAIALLQTFDPSAELVLSGGVNSPDVVPIQFGAAWPSPDDDWDDGLDKFLTNPLIIIVEPEGS